MISRKKNIVLIVTDQQRYDSLGCTGNSCALTPHLDALASEGTLCRRYFSGNSICMPSRASIVTGLYPSAHGVWTNGVPLPRRGYFPETSSEGGGLRPGQAAMAEIPTLADVFAGAGYRTASVGKLHLTPTASHPSFRFEECRQRWDDEPELADWHGPYFGFQHLELSIGHGEGITGHYGHWLDRYHPGQKDRVREAMRTAIRPAAGIGQLHRGVLPIAAHPTTWCADRASAYITDAKKYEQPFLLWVGIPDPHHPFTPPAELCEIFEKRDTMMSSCPIGEWADKPAALRRYMKPGGGWWCPAESQRLVRQYTDAMNHLIDRTVGRIVQSIKDSGQWDNTIFLFTSDHGDYLGDFGLVYKTSHASAALHKVPCILRAPGENLPRITDAPLCGADILPTLCRLANVPPPEFCQGEALGTTRQHLPMGQDFPAETSERNLSVYDERFRYTWYPETGEQELYDHQEDPHELHNCAANDIFNRDRLHTRLLDQSTRVLAPQAGRISIW